MTILIKTICTSLVFLYFTGIAMGQEAAQSYEVTVSTQIKEFVPSVAISRKDKNKFFVAAGEGQIFYSEDAGKTWEKTTIETEEELFGLPKLLAGKKGQIFYFDYVSVGSTVFPGNKLLVYSIDKSAEQWQYVGNVVGDIEETPYRFSVDYDRRNDEMVAVWTQFTEYGVDLEQAQSKILYSKSSNGKKWTTPSAITKEATSAADNETTATGPSIFVDREGRQFVSYSHDKKVFLDRSFDKGKMWLRSDINVGDQSSGGKFVMPNQETVENFPILGIDRSPGQYRGTLYLLWADTQDNGSALKLLRSNRNGDTWTQPGEITPDSTAVHIFEYSLAIDEFNGALYTTYFSSQSGYDIDKVWLTYSLEAGNKFKHVLLSEGPQTDENSSTHSYGTALDVFNNQIVAAWTTYNENDETVLHIKVFNLEELTK